MVKSIEDHYFVPCSPKSDPKSDRRTLRKNPLWKISVRSFPAPGEMAYHGEKRKFGKNKPLCLSEYKSKTEKQPMRPPHRKNK